jgi:putative intracellular protease/amidase
VTGEETGLFNTEALQPYEVFSGSGFDVELLSKSGS